VWTRRTLQIPQLSPALVGTQHTLHNYTLLHDGAHHDSLKQPTWDLGYECLDYTVSTSRPMQVASCKFADYMYIYIYIYLVGGFDLSEK
jgi:hypothetical protein